MKFEKIIETCIYTSNLQKLKDFYVNCLGLELVSEEKQRSIFLKVGKSMLLIFNPEKTLMTNYDKEDGRGGGGGGEDLIENYSRHMEL